MDALAEIKKLYFSTTKATIEKDFGRAIDLLKSLPSDEARERAAVYMEGIAQMRKEWGLSGRKPGANRPGSSPRPSGPPRAGLPARSGRSKASSRPKG